MIGNFNLLDETLRQYNKPFIDSMSQPINFIEFKDTLEVLYAHKINQSKIDFLKEFYNWNNGSRKCIIPSYWYIFSIRNTINNLKHDFNDELPYIRSRGIYPIMQAENRRWLCIKLYDDSKALVEVDFFDFERQDPSILAFDSFDNWIKFVTYCFENDIYVVREINGEKRLRFTEDESKSELFDKKYKEFNPKFGKLKFPY